MKYYAYSIALLAGAPLLACSGGLERELAQVDDIVPPDSGRDQRIPDAGEAPDGSDSDIADADDELVPNDADRSDFGSQCIKDEQCVEWIQTGLCARPACAKGFCIEAPLPDGTPCDDNNVCTAKDQCSAGTCHGGAFDVTAPGCLQFPTPGSLWITEIMGNPAEIPGKVDPVEGQWFEVRGSKPIRLEGLKVVYYEWDDGSAMPGEPAAPVIHQLHTGYSEIGYSVFLRSQDPTKNGWGSSQWGYSGIRFSKTKNARLMIVLPTWNGVFPVPDAAIVASTAIPAGVFSDAQKGRSWQLSGSSADEASGDWCHADMSGLQYIEKNYASPGQPNSDCP